MKTLSNEAGCCRVCGSFDLTSIIDFGNQPPANSLVYPDQVMPSSSSLELLICRDCSLLQLRQNLRPEDLFSDYVWVTSTSSVAKKYSRVFAEKVTEKCSFSNPLVVEIASNDGTFLKPFIDDGLDVIGVDPAANIAQKAIQSGIPTIIDFFSKELAIEIQKNHPDREKVVIARNVIPHTPDVASIFEGFEHLIGETGFGIIEFHDSGLLLRELQYDYIYHEHVFYYTLKSMKNLIESYRLKIIDVFDSPISGGSHVVVFTSSESNHSVSEELISKLRLEREDGLHSVDKWLEFGNKCAEHRDATKKLITGFGGNVVGYGASARSSTMLNYCGLSKKDISFIIDKNPLKHGKITAGSNIPILSLAEGVNAIDSEAAILLMAWNFADEIIDELRGLGIKNQIIMPFPNMPSIHAS